MGAFRGYFADPAVDSGDTDRSPASCADSSLTFADFELAQRTELGGHPASGGFQTRSGVEANNLQSCARLADPGAEVFHPVRLLAPEDLGRDHQGRHRRVRHPPLAVARGDVDTAAATRE